MNGISLYIIYWYTISKKNTKIQTFISDEFYAINYAGGTSNYTYAYTLYFI